MSRSIASTNLGSSPPSYFAYVLSVDASADSFLAPPSGSCFCLPTPGPFWGEAAAAGLGNACPGRLDAEFDVAALTSCFIDVPPPLAGAAACPEDACERGIGDIPSRESESTRPPGFFDDPIESEGSAVRLGTVLLRGGAAGTMEVSKSAWAIMFFEGDFDEV